jgi:hypothetical protein
MNAKTLVVVVVLATTIVVLVAALFYSEATKAQEATDVLRKELDDLRDRVGHLEEPARSRAVPSAVVEASPAPTITATAHDTSIGPSGSASATNAEAAKGWWCYKARCDRTPGACDGRRESDIDVDSNERAKTRGPLVQNNETGALEVVSWNDLTKALASGKYMLVSESRGVRYEANRPPCEAQPAAACLEYLHVLDESKYITCYDSMTTCLQETDRLTAPLTGGADWKVTANCKPTKNP